jgi:hypothetical protein
MRQREEGKWNKICEIKERIGEEREMKGNDRRGEDRGKEMTGEERVEERK